MNHFYQQFSTACCLCLLSMVMALGTSMPAYAGKAGTLLYPTRIVLADKDRTETLTIKNNGTATGSYRLEIEDMEMKNDGSIVTIIEGQQAPFSAKEMVKLSPRKMILKADENQTIRLLIRKPKDLEDGEYRSHLRVTLLDDNVDGQQDTSQVPQNLGISIKPVVSMIIPIILRHGKTEASNEISGLSLNNEGGKPVLKLRLDRHGNRSTLGNISVVFNKAGKEIKLGEENGIAVYRPLANRQIEVPLTLPEGVALSDGTLHVTYTDVYTKVLLAEGRLKQ